MYISRGLANRVITISCAIDKYHAVDKREKYIENQQIAGIVEFKYELDP